MHQEQSQSVSFESDIQKKIFNILTTKIFYDDKIYTEQDLQVDLVLRLTVPQQPYIPRRDDYQFNELFYNTPSYYGDAFQTVRQYINFQVDSNVNSSNFKQSVTKCMTSIYTISNSKQKEKPIYLDGIKDENMIIDCFHTYFPEIDVFTLKYNMIMLILQELCGLRVKTFIIDNSKEKCIYFLLSHSIQNLLKLADRHHIMKEVNMIEVDFNLNDPVDRAQRPLRYHSYFRQREDLMFEQKQKGYYRKFKLKKSNLKYDLIDEAKLSTKEATKFIQYCEQFDSYLIDILEEQITVTSKEKQYIFRYNRGKSNDGCYQLLKQMKQRQRLYQKTIELNKKYGYPVYEYKNCFFQFQLPPKNKPFFEKLALLMTYKYSSAVPDAELSLFNNMERSKLVYLSLQDYLKMENLYKIGLEVYAINNNVERFGTANFNLFSNMAIWKDFKKNRLIDEWHGFIPFFTNINAVRAYMGQKFAYELLVKMHLINFFAYLIPISLTAQFIGTIFFTSESNIFIYQFTMIYLVIVIICLTLFQLTWKRKQDEFIRNFLVQNTERTHEENYKGPFIRNIINDEPNEYTEHLTLWNRIIRFFAFLGVGILLMIEGFYFYGLRKAILLNYNRFPVVPTAYVSLPHLIFYGVFFWSNFLIYRFVFSKIIVKLIQFQNFPTKQQHISHLRGYVYMFTFGVQLLGPLFIYVIEPFQQKSCYSASCIYEFSLYIYSRYFIIFSFLLVKIIYVIGFYFTGSIIEIKDMLFEQNKQGQNYKSFQDKYNDLLRHIQKQYQKKDISFEIRQEALSLYYYCLYSITFPFCSVLAFGLLLLDYIVVRIDVLRNGRRPIANSKNIIRLSGIYSNIVHLCIIVNSWSVIYIQEILEYNFTEIIEYFVITPSQDNILLLKIIFTCILIGLLELISGVVKSFSSGLGGCKIQNRKRNMYRNFIKNNGKYQRAYKPPIIEDKLPIKTIFRTFSFESLTSLKKSRFKEKNKAEQLKYLNEKFFAPMIETGFQYLQTTKINKENENGEEIMEQTQSELMMKHRSSY